MTSPLGARLGMAVLGLLLAVTSWLSVVRGGGIMGDHLPLMFLAVLLTLAVVPAAARRARDREGSVFVALLLGLFVGGLACRLAG